MPRTADMKKYDGISVTLSKSLHLCLMNFVLLCSFSSLTTKGTSSESLCAGYMRCFHPSAKLIEHKTMINKKKNKKKLMI